MGALKMAEGVEGVNLASLDIQQLQQLKKQLEGECEEFSNSITSLKYAQARYEESNEALAAIIPENAGKKMLVPLTNSLYCAGSLGSTETVMVDIGTGYVVEKPVAKASEFFARKKEFCVTNVNKVQELLSAKQKNMESVSIVCQNKIAAESGGVSTGIA